MWRWATGTAAILAARRGAFVTGIDLTPAQIDRARDRCAWGDPEVAQARLAAAGLDATVETCDFAWRFPSAEAGFETFVTAAGPFVMFMATMQRQSLADTARTALLEAMAETNVATDGTCELPAAYLLMTATR